MMKKKLALLFLVSIFLFGFSDPVRVMAAEVNGGGVGETQDTGDGEAAASQVYLSRFPKKTVYTYGESFDSSGLELVRINSDGSESIITDFIVEGFRSDQLGTQKITIRYGDYSVDINVSVQAAKITNLRAGGVTMDSYTLAWDAAAGATHYEIYRKDIVSGTFQLLTTTLENSYTVYDSSTAVNTYMIRLAMTVDGVTNYGDFSEPFSAATAPGKVESVSVVNTGDTFVELTWSPVTDAAGYSIYRVDAATGALTYVGDSVTTSYRDTGLKSGTGYRYQVAAHRLNKFFGGELSPALDTSTNPAKVPLKSKAGDGKARLTWTLVNGATSYDIYMGDDISGYSLISTRDSSSGNTYIVEELTLGASYSFYIVAKRDYNGVVYEGVSSDLTTVTIEEILPTSTQPKYFADKAAFLKSTAYTTIDFFKNNVNFKKSYVIPGLVNTNVGGFTSTAMCPQGIAFAGNYLLMTAYDLAGEELSVVYCMDKKTRELVTTLILPTNAHVGGICYDGKNVWITTGSKVSAISYSDIKAAAKSGEPYVEVNFHSVCKVGLSASYIAYYNDKLWVGSYNELETTKLYSFSIDDYGSYAELTREDTMTMPTRVQGIAFTEDGQMIISRSCQLYAGLRGYMRRIDVYRPDLSMEGSGSIKLGSVVKYEYVPSMNEGIALDGGYLYVLFESAAFENASYKVDRISAFDLTKILPSE
ncbi:hypothetical protein HNQ56_001515 [Anaerotaenia torta]|uniref:bacterial Ig-like domain-containing protein n=1 Tax=Anaerotaenia torta TaxID=433293 RepID=UPI003D1CFB46